MDMNQLEEKLRIIVVGHTSVGKTTMIRTLIKRPVGEISPRANTTKTVKAECHDDLRAEFIDSPGFQNVGQVETYLKFGQDPHKEPNLEYDNIALDSIKKTDDIIYC